MPQDRVERRRGRRADVRAPLTIRRLEAREPGAIQEEVAGNISLAGVYFETERANAYAVNDVVITSVSIPASQTHHFPFTRLAGRSRVVRVSELPAQGSADRKQFGIALEFGEDLTALTAIPRIG